MVFEESGKTRFGVEGLGFIRFRVLDFGEGFGEENASDFMWLGIEVELIPS